MIGEVSLVLRRGLRAALAAAALGLTLGLQACGQSAAPPSTSADAPAAGAVNAPAPAPAPVASALGVWNGYWIVRNAGPRQGERLDVTWTFDAKGDFLDRNGVVGVWSQSGANVEFSFTGSTVFKGVIAGDHINGTFALPQGGGVSGDFSLTRGQQIAPLAAQPAAPAAVASLLGGWTGSWTVRTPGPRQGEQMNVNWTFSANGDFVDSGGGVVGQWRQDGATIEFNFTNSTVFKGEIHGNRVTGTFALPQGGGVSGDFVLTR